MKDEDKKSRIMKAAEKLFLSRSFHEICVEDIAKEAGIGKGTVYLYFKDKEDIFFQAAVCGFEEMCAFMNEAAAKEACFEKKLCAALKKMDRFFKGRRPLLRMLRAEWVRAQGQGGSLCESWRERRVAMISALASIISEGIAAGELRGETPAEELAEYLIGMMRTRGEEFDDLRKATMSIEELVDFFINGVGKRRK